MGLAPELRLAFLTMSQPGRKQGKPPLGSQVGGAATDALRLGTTFSFTWLKLKITDLCVDLMRFFQIKRLGIQEGNIHGEINLCPGARYN